MLHYRKQLVDNPAHPFGRLQDTKDNRIETQSTEIPLYKQYIGKNVRRVELPI